MIHILTLTWNKIQDIKNLKDDLEKIIYHTNEQIHWHIRDNGSSDNTCNEIASWKLPWISYWDIGHNRDNFAKGINFLFDKGNVLDNDLILLLNNDVRFGDYKSLNYMIDCMATDVSVVGARLLYPNSNLLQHAGVIFGPKYGNMPYHYRHKEENDVNAEKNRYFQAVTAACCLIRTKDFKAIGMMDNSLSWAFDDISMCLSIGKLGKKIVYCGKTTIYHEESASLKKNPVNKMFLNQNVKYFKDKWFGKYKLDHDLYLKDQNYNVIK